MRWYRSLTRRQRIILAALALGVVLVMGLLAWSVWRTVRGTMHAEPVVSPVPTPRSQTVSPLPTPTPQPSATPTVTPSPTPTPAFDVSRAGLVAEEVADARQSLTRWGTPLTLVGKTGMAQAIYRHYQVWPPLVIRARPALEGLRLWFWETLRLDVVAQTEATAAFYAPHTEELILRRDWPGDLETLETHLAYGYARALPDQYGDLLTLIDEAPTLDRKLALIAIAEGDALVSTMLYRGLDPESAAARRLRMEIAQAICPRWQLEDALLEDLTCLAYRLGSQFAVAQYQAGGTEALDELILRPPRSTEQLLDHERYVAFEQPVLLPPLTPELGDDWVLTTTETLGQALMGVVLAEWLQLPDGDIAEVVGWGGDLLQVWQGPEAETLAVWQIAWDDNSAAVRTYGALKEALPRPLVPGRISDTTPTAGLPRGRWWAGREGAAFLYRRSDTLWLIWGTGADPVEIAASAIEQATDLEVTGTTP